MDNPGNNVKVSLILPSLNVGRYIEECIESAMHQTLKEIEIICVDAGSTDGTLEIIKKYMKESWGFELDDLRTVVLRRSHEVLEMDLRTLD